MFLPIVLDFENNGLKFMLLKYLRFLDLCIQKDWAIITHEEFEKYELNFPNRNEYKSQMTTLYGYSLHNLEERKNAKQYFVPGEYYKRLEREKGSKLETALYLLNERDEELEDIIETFIQDLNLKGEVIEGILYFAACPRSVKFLAEKYNIPMISYETGPIRTPNYRYTTSYFCRDGLYSTNEIRERFDNFKREMDELPHFSREEILSIFLSHDNLGYLSLIDKIPKYEIGVAGGCALVVPYFAINKYMDHELIDDVLDIYDPKDVIVRLHPGDMYKATYRLSRYDAAKSPFGFLINSKRIAAVGSNMLFEAMLWKRIPCSMAEVMPASIMCNKDYTSAEEVQDVETFVNFFVFAFLVPGELAYDEEYLRWRLSSPSEKEIFMYNMMYYLKKFGITEEWLGLDSRARLNLLTIYRDYQPLSWEDLEKGMVFAQSEYKAGADLSTEMGNQLIKVENRDIYEEYVQTKEYLDNVLNSTSWKITYPIRRVLDVLKGGKHERQ